MKIEYTIKDHTYEKCLQDLRNSISIYQDLRFNRKVFQKYRILFEEILICCHTCIFKAIQIISKHIAIYVVHVSLTASSISQTKINTLRSIN